MSPRISIIIPVYNVELSLRECVCSILDQGLEEGEFEIILVDDGSTDHSGVICEEFARTNTCIKVIHQSNKGISEARNTGISAACGSFLCFVDSDDSLVSSGLKSLVPFCEENVDLVRYWSELVYEGATASHDEHSNESSFVVMGIDYLKCNGLETFCWNYLYRKSFIKENGLSFTPGIIGEDFAFMFDVMMANPWIVCVPRRIYRYNIHPGSISSSRSSGHSRRWVEDLLGTMARINCSILPFRETDPQLYKQCRSSLDIKMISLFSRMLTSEYSVVEFRSVLDRCHEAGLLPIQSNLPGKWNRASKRIIELLTSSPSFYPLFGKVYTRVFLPYLYPKIDRNKG